MKAHLLLVLIIDHDNLGSDGVTAALEDANYPNDCIGPRVAASVEHDIGEWSDEHPLNKCGTDVLAWLNRKPDHGGWASDADGYTHKAGWRIGGNATSSWLIRPDGEMQAHRDCNIAGVTRHGFTVRSDVAALMDYADGMIGGGR